jgi:hypothetical protein
MIGRAASVALLEVVGPEILVLSAVLEHVVSSRRHARRHAHNRRLGCPIVESKTEVAR